jgi:hypothetical protein
LGRLIGVVLFVLAGALAFSNYLTFFVWEQRFLRLVAFDVEIEAQSAVAQGSGLTLGGFPGFWLALGVTLSIYGRCAC